MERAQGPPPSDSRPASLEFNEAVDANIVRLVDAYRDILRGSQVNATNPMAKQLQDSVSAASIVSSQPSHLFAFIMFMHLTFKLYIMFSPHIAGLLFYNSVVDCYFYLPCIYRFTSLHRRLIVNTSWTKFIIYKPK